MLLAPELMLAGFAANEPIEGVEPVPWVESEELVVPPQLARPTPVARTVVRMSREQLSQEALYLLGVRLLPKKELAESEWNLVIAIVVTEVY